MIHLARLGLAARGIVYLLVGWLALKAAMFGGRPSDNQSALASLSGDAAGLLLLATIAMGLVAYGLWRMLDALFATPGESRKPVVRIGHAVSGVTHLLLGFFAVSLAVGTRRVRAANPQDESARDWTAFLLSQPFGQGLVLAAGVVLLGVAAYQLKRAYRGDFMNRLRGDSPAPQWLERIGRVGFAARGIVFLITGYFLIAAAVEHDPSEAGGMGKALSELQDQAYGSALLSLAAAGLVLFGLFSLMEAKCRFISNPSLPQGPLRS